VPTEDEVSSHPVAPGPTIARIGQPDPSAVAASFLRQESRAAVAFDLHDLAILGANRRLYELLGKDPGSLRGLGLSDLLHPAGGSPAPAACELLASGHIESFRARRHFHRADGTGVLVRATVRTVALERTRFGLAIIDPDAGEGPMVVADIKGGQAPLGQLTPRQHEIVCHLARGDSVDQIAAATYLSTSTVRNHLSVIYKKFGVHSQAGLLAKLLEIVKRSTESDIRLDGSDDSDEIGTCA
jgi:DNA-binding CsgD family transcriptional regulator